MLYGNTHLRKSSHLKYLESFLSEYSPKFKNKWFVLDQGGELYNNPTINNLFRKFGPETLPTSPDASFQNDTVERAYYTDYQGVNALLIGVSSFGHMH